MPKATLDLKRVSTVQVPNTHALQRVVEVARVLNSMDSLQSVLDFICESFEDLLKTNHCSVNLIDETEPTGIRTLMAHGIKWSTWNRKNLRAVSRDEFKRVGMLWEKSYEPVVYPDVDSHDFLHRLLVPGEVRAVALFPLHSSGTLKGFVVTGFANTGGPNEEGLAAGLALCEQAATALARAELKESLRESERQLIIAAERDRMAQDLHDSIGRTLKAIGLGLANCIAQAPEAPFRRELENLHQLAINGDTQYKHAVHSLLFLQVQHRGLVRSLRELASKFQMTAAIATRLVVKGKPYPLALTKENVIFRAAHEGLMNVERHSQASAVGLLLIYEKDKVTLVVRDDGIGFGRQDPFAPKSGHFGITTMKRMVEEAGGHIDLRDSPPRGVCLEVEVPARNKKS